jgi:hypothetical protein
MNSFVHFVYFTPNATVYNMEDKESAWSAARKQKQREYYQRYLKTYHKKRRADFRAKGICVSCQKVSAVPGKSCCQQCLNDKKLCHKFGTAGPYRQLYEELFESQHGKCGICAEPMKRPLLDHSHITMEVRGLLCQSCNIGLGQFKDDPKILAAALNYINTNAGVGIIQKRNE